MSRNSVRARLITGFTLLCLGVFATGLLSGLERNLNSDTAFAQNLIRLHVIAHSNLPQDQDLKLLVRDAVLQETKDILGQADDKEEAYQLLLAHGGRLQERAQEVVWAQGFSYPVQVRLGHFPFPHREYGQLALPEGWYDAVRIEIGEARGDNWWCVLFPPLCLGELQGTDNSLVQVSSPEEGQQEQGHRYVLRFRLWEQAAQTRYAQALRKWLQASAAGLSALAN